MKKILVLAAVLLVLAGCGPWVKTEGSFSPKSNDFKVDLPAGWMRSNTDDYLLMSKDGLRLQRIVVLALDTTKEGQQFKHTKKRVSADMLPQEAAEVIVDDFQSDTTDPLEKVEEDVPALVGGKPGFRLQLVYRTADGLRYRYTCYGVLIGTRLYRIIYAAPVRHYYDTDRDIFEAIAKSFRLTG